MSHREADSFVEQELEQDTSSPSKLRGAAASVMAQLRIAESPKRCIGIDLGKKLAVCEVRDGEVVHRAMLTPKQLKSVLGPTTEPARVAIEACREAWFYNDLLQSWGHQVLVVDTTRVRALGIGHGRRKNDRIDAKVLATAVEIGRIPLAHVLSPERRELRAELGVRRALIGMRTKFVTTVRGLLRSWGVEGPKCGTDMFARRVKALAASRQLAAHQYAQIKPLIATLIDIEPHIQQLDAKLEAVIKDIDVGELLMTCPGVGPIVACSFVSVVDDAARFRSAHQLESYLGLVPSENTSGKRKLGAITKAGNAYLRSLLVQAGWSLLRARSDNALKLWGQAIAKRRGKRVAVVAVARRLAGILWAMWRDGVPFDPALLGEASAKGLRKQAQQTHGTADVMQGCA